MRRRLSRVALVTSMVLGGTYLFAGGNLVCGSTLSEASIASVDMCFVFDCTNGIFGGLIQPCSSVVGVDTNPDSGTGDGFPGPTTGTFFADCPTDDTGL